MNYGSCLDSFMANDFSQNSMFNFTKKYTILTKKKFCLCFFFYFTSGLINGVVRIRTTPLSICSFFPMSNQTYLRVLITEKCVLIITSCFVRITKLEKSYVIFNKRFVLDLSAFSTHGIISACSILKDFQAFKAFNFTQAEIQSSLLFSFISIFLYSQKITDFIFARKMF